MIKSERAERKALTEAILKLVDAIDRFHINTLPDSQVEEVLNLDAVEANNIDIGAGTITDNKTEDSYSIKNIAIKILKEQGTMNSTDLLTKVNIKRNESLRPFTNMKGLSKATQNIVSKTKGYWCFTETPIKSLRLKQIIFPNME